MQDFGTKADNSPPPGGQLSAAEFNNLATENENAVLRAGLTLSGASETQLAQSLFLHSVKSESFQDSGAANAYVATPISGTGGVLLPADYTNLDGSVISFKASNANTAASTLNIGQTTGTLIGTKPIRTQADTALPANSIAAGQYAQVRYNAAFDGGSGAWELLPWSISGGKLLNIRTFSTPGASVYTPTAGTGFIRVRISGGGGAGGGAPATAAGVASLGGAGSAGSYAEALILSGFSGLTITVGAGGTGASGGVGTNGGSSSLGSLVVAPGGISGTSAPSLTSAIQPGSVQPGVPSGGNILSTRGNRGGPGIVLSPTVGVAGNGGIGLFGTSVANGGDGQYNAPSTAAQVGNNGAPGIVIIEEYSR